MLGQFFIVHVYDYFFSIEETFREKHYIWLLSATSHRLIDKFKAIFINVSICFWKEQTLIIKINYSGPNNSTCKLPLKKYFESFVRIRTRLQQKWMKVKCFNYNGFYYSTHCMFCRWMFQLIKNNMIKIK